MVVAYVLMIVEMGKEHEAAQAVSKIDGIEEVAITYGSWDMVIKVVADSLPILDHTITKLRQLSFIKQTATLVGK